MGYQDRDWYREHYKQQERAQARPTFARPASARRFDRVGPRPGRPVVMRAKPPGFWSRILSASAWKIALFWVAVALGLTLFFQPIALERAANRAIQPAVQLFCSASSKCT